MLFVKELWLWCNCSIQNLGQRPSFEILAFAAFLHKLKKESFKIVHYYWDFLNCVILQKSNISEMKYSQRENWPQSLWI